MANSQDTLGWIVHDAPSQKIYLVRHGETEWSKSGQHTGRTDLPLTPEGERVARELGATLGNLALQPWTSPLARAISTARLAGFPDALVDPDLREWDYGVYEGRTTADIRREQPGWSVWLSPIPGGESLDDVAQRARRVIERADAVQGDVALFSHGHFLRIFGACWIGQSPVLGRNLALDTATVGILGYERKTRVIRRWNGPRSGLIE
jgi:probable phosphoglycerate mutase